jgi:hypothetical protein
MRFRQRARDLAIEVLIAVVLVTAYVIYLFKFPKGPRAAKIGGNVGGTVLIVAIVAGLIFLAILKYQHEHDY